MAATKREFLRRPPLDTADASAAPLSLVVRRLTGDKEKVSSHEYGPPGIKAKGD